MRNLALTIVFPRSSIMRKMVRDVGWHLSAEPEDYESWVNQMASGESCSLSLFGTTER